MTTKPTWDLVIEDMKERDAKGRKEYGVPLVPFNGRNSLLDLYEELLDAVVYIKNLLIEQEAFLKKVNTPPTEEGTR